MSLLRLTPQQLEFYREQGYLHLAGLLGSAEAAALRAECHALAGRLGDHDATWASAKDGGTRLTHCHDVQFRSAAFTRLLLDPRLTGLAQDLIGPNVELHHSKMFIKPPERGSPFPMHQDYHYFPHERHTMLAVIFHFDDAPLEKGCLRVVPGSHRLGPLPTSTQDHTLPEHPLDAATAVPARAGDAIVFSYLTIHGSGLNVSDEARTTLLVQLRDPLDRPLVDRHRSRGQGMLLAGIDPKREPFFAT
jgi:phytanoyl-CoA hydroxylase